MTYHLHADFPFDLILRAFGAARHVSDPLGPCGSGTHEDRRIMYGSFRVPPSKGGPEDLCMNISEGFQLFSIETVGKCVSLTLDLYPF